MKVKSLELELEWPRDIEIYNLREFILEEIKPYGVPLRWAITEVKKSEKSLSFRKLFIEAAIIIF